MDEYENEYEEMKNKIILADCMDIMKDKIKKYIDFL